MRDAWEGRDCNPGLAEWMETGKNPLDEKRFRDFHEDLLNGYREVMPGDRNTLFKMKELWTYMLTLFPDSEKEAKEDPKGGQHGGLSGGGGRASRKENDVSGERISGF